MPTLLIHAIFVEKEGAAVLQLEDCRERATQSIAEEIPQKVSCPCGATYVVISALVTKDFETSV